MRVVAVIVVALVLAPGALASGGRPVAIVTAETSNQVIGVSLGQHGGRVLKRVHVADPLMVAAPPHGPAVVVNPHGVVTLLARHSLRPIKVFHSFRSPKVATIAPNGRLAYVTDERSGDLTVIDLARRRIVHRVYVGLEAHHLSVSPNGKWIWVALGETATTVVRLEATNPRKPRVVARFRPRWGAHDVSFAPDGRTVWITSPSRPYVSGYSTGGRLLWTAGSGQPPGHVAFSGASALVPSGYGSSLYSFTWSSPSRAPRKATIPYGSFNLATYGRIVVTTSLFTGQVTELEAGTLHRFWTTKVAPAARYVAISVWPDPTPHRTLSVGSGHVVRRFTMREPAGAIRLVRLVVPHGVRARVAATIPGLAGVSLGSGAPCRLSVDSATTCRRHAGYDVWTQQEEACPMPRAVWRVRLVKRSGPAARIRFVFRVGPR